MEIPETKRYPTVLGLRLNKYASRSQTGKQKKLWKFAYQVGARRASAQREK